MSLFGLTACQHVEIQYAKPSPAGDFAAAEAQANDHYEFVAFPKAVILVQPVDDSAAAPKGDAKADDAKGGDKSDAAKTADDASKGAPAQNGGKATTPKTPKKKTKQAGVAAAASAPDAAASSPATDKTKTADDSKKNADAPVTPPPALSDSLASAVIDGKKWQAKVVLMPDDKRQFVAKGVVGFWKSTTIALTKYQNTDMVSSVSSTAENLVPKRIGQAASIVASVVKIGAVLGVDGQTITKLPLQSFRFEVPGGSTSGTINDDWTYSFDYDSDGLPAGTVSFDVFSQNTANRTVGYWPVPACRSATLLVNRGSDHLTFVFHVIVSSPDAVRLQPLPVSGKVDFGSVCGSTTSGNATSDPLSVTSDDLTAVLQAVKTVKDAKSPDTGASGAAKGGAATTKK